MSPAAQPPVRLSLWRANLLDQEWSVSTSELGHGFVEWLASHEPPLNFHRALTVYLAAPDGLNSTWEVADLDAIEGQIYLIARKAWVGYLERQDPTPRCPVCGGRLDPSHSMHSRYSDGGS